MGRLFARSVARAALVTLALLCLESRLSGQETTQPGSLRVMTYNMHHGRGTDKIINLLRVADVIRKAHPDLVALQEVDIRTSRSGGVDQLEEIARLTKMYGRFAKARDYDGGEYGQAVLSRWPVESLQVHLLPGPSEEEQRIAWMASISPGGPLPEILFVGTHLHHKDEPLRLQQTKKLLQLLDEQPTSRSAVLLGDLNAEPGSKVMRAVLEKWQDTTSHEDLTFPSGNPIKKIDWILVPGGGGWRIAGAKVIDESVASDHRPVVAELEWGPARK